MRSLRPPREVTITDICEGSLDLFGYFYKEVLKTVQKWLNRRSQRKSCKGKKFKRMLEYFEVPKPKVTEKKRLHKVALR